MKVDAVTKMQAEFEAGVEVRPVLLAPPAPLTPRRSQTQRH
jgi:hypothetical protein